MGEPFYKRSPKNGSLYAIGPLSVLSCPVCDVGVYCDQTVGWIRMPLGMGVGLGAGHTVLDGERPPSKKGTAPNFRHMSIVVKGLDGSRCHLARR